jgi:hypothetical protein
LTVLIGFAILHYPDIYLKEGIMFKNENICVIKIDEPRAIRLEDDSGQAVALIFINQDEVIVRGDVVCSESKILPPSIKNL